MPRNINALIFSHGFIKNHIKEGDFCIDATAGRGRDTALLAQLVGSSGRVLAFDIQQDALDSTKELLKKEELADRAELILDSHSNMAQYTGSKEVDCIVFNLGWLPGGDHGIFTMADTSIKAIENGLELLRSGGLMSICIYYGRDCGFDEKDAILEFLPTLDSSKYSVLVTEFVNRPNNPPIPVIIQKH